MAGGGLTLSPEQLAQVWTPYYQGEKDFTGEAPGMGLGLPLVWPEETGSRSQFVRSKPVLLPILKIKCGKMFPALPYKLPFSG